MKNHLKMGMCKRFWIIGCQYLIKSTIFLKIGKSKLTNHRHFSNKGLPVKLAKKSKNKLKWGQECETAAASKIKKAEMIITQISKRQPRA